MKKLPLSKREKQIWGYILGYLNDYGYTPTLFEIGEFLGGSRYAKQNAYHYIRKMEEKGYIKRGKGWRNIKVVTSRKV